MPKPAQDLRLPGIKFEDAVRRILAAPPMPTSNKAKQKKTVRHQKRAKS
jgi:hypothetical protein